MHGGLNTGGEVQDVRVAETPGANPIQLAMVPDPSASR